MNKTNLMFKEAFPYLKKYWKPKVGDVVFNRFGEEDIIVRVAPGTPDERSINTLREEQAIMAPTLISRSGLFWKAHQEDLQEIAMTYLINKEMEEDFEAKGLGFEWMKREYGFSLLVDSFGLWNVVSRPEKDHTQLWLSFVMETCLGLRWNNEYWVCG